MNDKQLEEAKLALREEIRAIGCGFVDGQYIHPPKEYEARREALRCVDMINSVLAYGCRGYTAEEVMQHEEQAQYNYLAEYVQKLGRAAVVELIDGQIKSMSGIAVGTFEDDEGVVYNSIIWKE